MLQNLEDPVEGEVWLRGEETKTAISKRVHAANLSSFFHSLTQTSFKITIVQLSTFTYLLKQHCLRSIQLQISFDMISA